MEVSYTGKRTSPQAPTARREEGDPMSLACSKCLMPVAVDPVTERVPPWCPRCGADRSTYAPRPSSVLGILCAASPPRPADGPPAAGAAGAAAPGRQEGPRLPPQVADIPPEDLAALVPPPRRPPPVGIVLPAITVLCLVGFLVLASTPITKLSSYGRAEGRVVDVVTTRKTTRGDRVHPVVAYQVGGVSHRFQGEPMGFFGPRYKPGDTVEVLYPPEHPGEGSLNSFAELWSAPLVCAIPGFGLLAVWLCARRGIGMAGQWRGPDRAPSR